MPILSCYYGTIARTLVVTSRATDGPTFTGTSRACIIRLCVIFARGTRRYLHMSTSCSLNKIYANMKSSVTITLALSTRVDSKGIRNVDSAGRGSMEMMSFTHIVGTSMKGVIFVIEEAKTDSSNITWTITP